MREFVVAFLLGLFLDAESFLFRHHDTSSTSISPSHYVLHTLKLQESRSPQDPSSASASNNNNSKKGGITLAELREKMRQNPSKYQAELDAATRTKATSKATAYRRSRTRVSNPQQTYVYASQRQRINATEVVAAESNNMMSNQDAMALAKELGLKITAQHCDPFADTVIPTILGQFRISDETGSGSMVYIINKPSGWAILGGGSDAKQKAVVETSTTAIPATPSSVVEEEDEEDMIDSNDTDDEFDYNEEDLLALMSPEEQEEYLREVSSEPTLTIHRNDVSGAKEDAKSNDISPATLENLKRIKARAAAVSKRASFAHTTRPSVISWLKEVKAQEGVSIRGGNYWTALSGAVEVDDSGLVLLCPKAHVKNVFVDQVDYVAVVGTGGYMSSQKKSQLTKEMCKIDLVARVKKGRGEDIVHTVRVTVADRPSTCSDIVDACQSQYQDGIRGDPAANPFDRRSHRRLIHCIAMRATSLTMDDSAAVETEQCTDAMAIYADRRNHFTYKAGSFLGRKSLRENPLTNCYREISGASDGYPGWVVDRYDKWLLVQHDPKAPRGPLPSIHDGNTAGVYYLESSPDRSAMGSSGTVRPRLLEGKAAPALFPVLENGVTYMVSLDRDLSTGLFLDQRPQRAWLLKHCSSSTSVLNCFAHTGAFSVTAAVAGASTVNIDMSKKWLDRFPDHLAANHIAFDERHDCIHGDCFEWLAKLAKRGEKYDIVIVDPPSFSLGGRKKKSWSAVNDMHELVALAAPLVKRGGLLWTTTNSASIHPMKFARACRKGLDDAGVANVKLERLQPMPSDFQFIGLSPVKNLVWRFD
jgi:23S rRNA (cytosine1962-C5)-methyltransferase